MTTLQNNEFKRFLRGKMDIPLQNDGIRKKAAFTLAEVLITLGIIGVVAAMTIPNLITNYQKKVTVTKLQKAISVLNQAYRRSVTELGDFLTIDGQENYDSKEYFEQYWAPYIKSAVYCSTPEICGYSSNSPFILLSGKKAGTSFISSKNTRASFVTSDGFMYMLFTGSQVDEAGTMVTSSEVWIDINAGKGPNTFGKDVFSLMRDSESQSIYPSARSNDLSASCQKHSVGNTCAELIRVSGWKMSKDYPW